MIGDLASRGPKTFVFDLDGVVYVDRAAIPGAGETLTALAQAGHQVLFATNNSSRSVGTVVGQEHRVGGPRCRGGRGHEDVDEPRRSVVGAAVLVHHQSEAVEKVLIGVGSIAPVAAPVGVAAGERGLDQR